MGCASTKHPLDQSGGLVPVATQEFVQQRLHELFRYLRDNGFLLHKPLTGFPDDYWDIKELDPITLERIPEPTLDPTKELPDDIIEGLSPAGSPEVKN